MTEIQKLNRYLMRIANKKMVDKILSNAQTGNFNDLRINAVDPSDIETDKNSPKFGLPRFLGWVQMNSGQVDGYWKAIGKDGKVYTIKEDKPVRQGVVTVE